MTIPDRVGRYEIIAELGRGGMATVYRAFDPRFQREVALKVLPHHFLHDENFGKRFLEEAQLIASIEHPAVVPVYDFGGVSAEPGSQPYLAMRLLTGGSLADRIANEQPLPLADIAAVLNTVAAGLEKAHRSKIIHRDIKPQNVMFDEEGRPYVVDFGIARMAEATRTMTIVGTPAYMSPEQVQGDQQLDGRSDVYSMGVMLFELLTGRRPYDAPTATKLMMKHLLEPVPDVRAVNPQLPAEASAVVRMAMAKDREQRFRTPTALAQAVKELANLPAGQGTTLAPQAAGVPVQTPPAPPRSPTGRPPTGRPPADRPPTGRAPGERPPTPPRVAAGQRSRKRSAGPISILLGAGASLLLLLVLGGGAVLLILSLQNRAAGDEAATATAGAQALAAALDATPSPSATPTERATPTPLPPSATPSTAPSAAPTETRRPTVTLQITGDVSRTLPEIVVNISSAAVRQGPGTNYGIVATLQMGDRATILARNGSGSWLNILLEDGRRGWISATVVDLLGTDDVTSIELALTIPAAVRASTPTSTPVPPTPLPPPTRPPNTPAPPTNTPPAAATNTPIPQPTNTQPPTVPPPTVPPPTATRTPFSTQPPTSTPFPTPGGTPLVPIHHSVP